MCNKYLDKPFDWGLYGISSNPIITLKWIETFPDKPWLFGGDGLSCNPNLTIEWIEKYPDKPWDWRYISSNKNISYELLKKYIDKIDFTYLSKNTFEFLNKQI
jgi:hypothetical protein